MNNQEKQYFFISGLPRSGSNLLSSILNQNPEVYSEGLSPVCRIVWKLEESFMVDNNLIEDMLAVNRFNKENIKNIYKSIFDGYYFNIDKKKIIDKNFSWTTKENLKIINECFGDYTKIIILERNIEEVVRSLKNVYINNGFSDIDSERYIFSPGSPLMRPLSSLIWSKINRSESMIFIDYESLISNTEKTIKKISTSLDCDYNWNLKNINFIYPENTDYVFPEFMEVRKEIKKRKLDIELSIFAYEQIEKINYILSMCKKEINGAERDIVLKFYEKNL